MRPSLCISFGFHLLVTIAIASAEPAATAPATNETALNPMDVVEQFISELQDGDVDGARGLVFDFGHHNDPMLRDRLKRLAASKWPAHTRESMEKPHTAVVAIVEQKEEPDFDPVFLIKREGRYFVMPGISKYRGGIAKPTDEEMAEFDALRAWFKERKSAGFR